MKVPKDAPSVCQIILGWKTDLQCLLHPADCYSNLEMWYKNKNWVTALGKHRITVSKPQLCRKAFFFLLTKKKKEWGHLLVSKSEWE